MKHFAKLGLYKASNVTFNPKSLEAFSYSHWKFVALINGHVVFNTHRYSNTTARHQYKVRQLMRELGVEIDFEVDTHCSLTSPGWVEDTLEHLDFKIDDLEAAIAKPRSHADKNMERRREIYHMLDYKERLQKAFIMSKNNVIQMRRIK